MQTVFEQRSMELQNEANRVIINKAEEFTLRDYFAGQAMIALSGWNTVQSEEDFVRRSYRVADLMIKQRKEKENA